YAHYGAWLPPPIVRSWLRYMSLSHCNASDQVAVPTEPIRIVLRDYGVRRPVSVVPTGLPRAAPAQRDPTFPRAAFGIPPGAPIVLYAGRLAREKNLELLFAAFARVAASSPSAHLLLVGGGPSE